MSLKSNQLSNLTSVIVHGDVPDWAYEAARTLLLQLKEQDLETFLHCQRVGEYARLLAKDLGLSEYQQKVAEFSGLLHDVGKKEIAFEVLHKPSKLSPEEYNLVQDHSLHGELLLDPYVHHEFFRQIAPIVRGHHERMDGTGYPDKKRGEEVPLLARVVLIVDTLDAMGADRTYRSGQPIEMIYKEIAKHAGTQFDDQIARAFLKAHPLWNSIPRDRDTFEQVFKKAA